MTMRLWRPALAAVVSGFMLNVAAFAADDDAEKVMTTGNVSYVSGGVSEDSRDRLQALINTFNLKLVLARKSGEYLSDAPLRISDAKGATLLEATADGPIFMANLPPGSYEVAVTIEGQTLKQRAAVVRGKLLTLHFRWP